jgi:D-arabinose 1-dehydrogenase-like Zn-dependent alcohol dehydrogenase
MQVAQGATALMRKWLVHIVAIVGVGGLGSTAVYGAQILDAVKKVDQHEARLNAMELNVYLTCLMQKQVMEKQMRDIQTVLEIPMECVRPGSLFSAAAGGHP